MTPISSFHTYKEEISMNSTAKEICAIIDDKMASVSSTFSSDVLNHIYQKVYSQFYLGHQRFNIGPLEISFEYIADCELEKYVPKWDISYVRTSSDSSDSIVKTWFENAIPLMRDMAANGKTIFSFSYILYIECEAETENILIRPGKLLRSEARRAFHPYSRWMRIKNIQKE